MSDAPTVQRSFRLSAETDSLLNSLAEAGGESRNSMVERLLAEALRCERHPLIRFREGAAGRREPGLVGTRLLVRQLMSQLRSAGGDAAQVADYLGLPESSVRAAVSYYADFAAEVDSDMEWAERREADELARWERQRAALG